MKQLITYQEAALYSGISKDLIRQWMQKELLSVSHIGEYDLIDPDEFDLLVEFRDAHGKYTANPTGASMRRWADAWLDPQHQEEVQREITIRPIATFTNRSKVSLGWAWYQRKDDLNVKVQAVLLQFPFRVISGKYAVKTGPEGGFLIRLLFEKEYHVRYLKEDDFRKIFEYVAEVEYKSQKEEEFVEYLFRNTEFREKIRKLLLSKEEKIIEKRLEPEEEMKLVEEMIQEKMQWE